MGKLSLLTPSPDLYCPRVILIRTGDGPNPPGERGSLFRVRVGLRDPPSGICWNGAGTNPISVTQSLNKPLVADGFETESRKHSYLLQRVGAEDQVSLHLQSA